MSVEQRKGAVGAGSPTSALVSETRPSPSVKTHVSGMTSCV